MEFKKYSKITNHYQQKFINGFLGEYPELLTCEYILVEKCHGSNIAIYFSPNESWRLAKRNSFLGEGANFYDVWNVVERYEHIFQNIQDYVGAMGITIRLFGELYGPGVQKGINYGKEKQVGFFDVMDNGEVLSPHNFYVFSKLFRFYKHTLPSVARVQGLQAALDYNVEFNSLLNPIEDNICEGIVIKPYRKVYYDKKGRWFCLKKKNEKFMERVKAPKPPQPSDPEVTRLNLLFRGYINDNRLQSVFSKEGEIEEPSQIGTYIKMVLEDAKTDFLLEYGEDVATLGKKELRQVYNLGGTIAKMLKGYL